MKEHLLYLALILLLTTVACNEDFSESNDVSKTDEATDTETNTETDIDTDTNTDTNTEIKPEDRVSEIDTKEERKSKQFWPFFHR